MPALCDICQERPATSRVTVVQNGQRKTIDICDYDYRQLMRHQNIMNPFDSLLGRGGSQGSLMDLAITPEVVMRMIFLVKYRENR